MERKARESQILHVSNQTIEIWLKKTYGSFGFAKAKVNEREKTSHKKRFTEQKT